MSNPRFTELLEKHRDRVYSHALYCLRDPEDAEDVTQETFVRLWEKQHDVDPARVAGWLTRVVHNLCIDQTRRRKTVRTHFGRPDPEACDTLAAPASRANDPEFQLALSERQTALLDALATLPEETRSVMIMHYYQGMKLQEIAAVLDKTVSALKVQVHRARKSLRLVLAPSLDASPTARMETGS
jgi:RNA polymerase sigma-70 factor (ECF subfamily)